MNPSISGKNVVWSQWDGNDYELYYWDGDEQRTTQLTINSVDDLSPRISTDPKESLDGGVIEVLDGYSSNEPVALALTADGEEEPAALLAADSTTATEPGSTLDTATPIDSNPDTPELEPLTGFQIVSDSIGGDSDPSDYYRFDVSEQGLLTLLLNNLSAGAKIDLLDSTGTVLQSSTQTGTEPRLMDVPLSPGTYYVYVRVEPETVGEATNYDLTLTMNEDEIFRVEHIGDDGNGEIVKVSGMNFDENGEPFENFSQQESGIKEILADGGRGNDILEIKAGVHSPAYLSGGDGEDQIQGGDGNDILKGDNGFDQINGALGEDTIEGGDDNDYLLGGAGGDILNGGNGFDTASYSTSATGVNIDLTTGQTSGGDAAGDQFVSIENLEGTSQDDVLKGNGEDNFFEGGAGQDNLDGGDGKDTALYLNSDAGVTVNLATGLASEGHATGDVLNSIENIEGSSYNDNLTGSQ